MTVLITGASGFLGRHLTPALRARGHVVIELVRDFPPVWPALEHGDPDGSQWRPGMVFGGLTAVERAIAEYECDTVVHLAAQTQVSTAAAHPEETLEANVRGTWQVLEACRRQKVKRLIVASSDKAYGAGEVPYLEEQSLRPHGIYATSKACADMLATAYAQEYGLSIAVTRCGNLYGPGHTNWSTLIPGSIRDVLRGHAPRLRSNGGPKRDYLHVNDAIWGYLRLIDARDLGGAFNFGTCRGTSALDVAKLVAQVAGRPDLVPVVACADAGGAGGIEIDEQTLACGRAGRLLDWSPQYNLERGLQVTIPWYRKYFERSLPETGQVKEEVKRRS